MDTKQKKELKGYFNELGLYGAVCLQQDEIFEDVYSQNIIELGMDSDAIFHKETVMRKDNVSLKKDELYKLAFPVPLDNLEFFTVTLKKESKENSSIAFYENTLNSLLIRSNIDVTFLSIGLWTHQNNGVIYI